MNLDKLKKYYRLCYMIRRTEEKIEELFSQGKLFGTTHGCIGQEIIAASVLTKIDINKDSATGTHRSHGHFLALFEDPKALLCELMGRKEGVVEGKGGSQHLYRGNFYTNGITGGMIPVATGIALSEKLNRENNIVIAFLGDGGINEGYVYESFNFAAVYDLPILFVLENNQYAMSTSIKNASSGNFIDRIDALKIKSFYASTGDIENVESVSFEAVDYVRNNEKPAFIHFDTYRFCGHSKSDRCEYRSNEEESYWLEKDPLKQMIAIMGENEASKIKKEIDELLEEVVKEALKSEWPEPKEVYKEVKI